MTNIRYAQEKSKIWKRGAPLFYKNFRPKIIFLYINSILALLGIFLDLFGIIVLVSSVLEYTLQWFSMSPINMDLWAFSPKYCFLVFGNLTTISMIHNWPTQRPRPWFASQRTAYSLFQQSHNCSYTSWSRGRWKNSNPK